MTTSMWNPYPGVPNPSLVQVAEYVNAASTPEERVKRKQQVFGFVYSADPKKISGFINYLQRSNKQL